MASETVTEGNNMGTPSVHLPPAALRLETLDFDPTGHPYYKFPPFLSPPEGVKLIPFDKFRPHGIQITLESDVEELDGEGIPTVELGAKHATVPGERDEKKKKKKKSKKEGDEPKKSASWWDDWAEGEDLRRGDSYNPNTPRTDRFAQGATDFPRNRKWNPQLQSLYDHFRHYVGLLAHPVKSRFGRGKEDQGDEADDDEDDEAELTAEKTKEQGAETNPFPKPEVNVDADDDEPKISEVDLDFQRRLEEEEDAREMRMDTFLNDPEQSIKIFFSSFYKDKGLFWSEPKLRDGPILLSFFLGFFIRNRIMPDYEKAFRKAYKITEQARLELPQTTKISMAIPDAFGRACTSVWEKQEHTWKQAMEVDTVETAPESAQDPAPAPTSEPVKEWEAQLRERGVEQIEVDIDAIKPAPNGWGAPMDGIVEEDAEGGGGGWGDGTAVMRDISNPWAVPAATQEDWGAGEAVPAMMSFLGPTTIPLTYAVQRAEKSTRQIVAFTPPNADAKGLEGVLGTLVLAPWKTPKKGTTVTPPEMITDLTEGSTFDPARDVITVLVDPTTTDALRENMGLRAVFVQVADTAKEPKDKKKSRSRGKGKSKAKGSEDKEWWYIEWLYEVIPSFWTEAIRGHKGVH